MPYLKNMILEFRRMDNNQALFAGTGHPDYKIYDIQGHTGLSWQFTTAVNPQVPGVAVTNSRADARTITIELDISQDLREFALQFFNPNFLTHLAITWNGVQRWIPGYARPVRVDAENIFAPATLKIDFYCPSPYLRDMSDFGKDITFRQPLIAFPFVMLADRGHVASYRVPGNELSISNPGVVAVPVRVLFQALGDVSNPSIILNKVQHITTYVDMHAGDTLEVNTDPAGIYVRLNGASALNKTDRLSTFFQLPVGESLITYQATDEFDRLSVTVYYTPQYLGV